MSEINSAHRLREAERASSDRHSVCWRGHSQRHQRQGSRSRTRPPTSACTRPPPAGKRQGMRERLSAVVPPPTAERGPSVGGQRRARGGSARACEGERMEVAQTGESRRRPARGRVATRSSRSLSLCTGGVCCVSSGGGVGGARSGASGESRERGACVCACARAHARPKPRALPHIGTAHAHQWLVVWIDALREKLQCGGR